MEKLVLIEIDNDKWGRSLVIEHSKSREYTKVYKADDLDKTCYGFFHKRIVNLKARR